MKKILILFLVISFILTGCSSVRGVDPSSNPNNMIEEKKENINKEEDIDDKSSNSNETTNDNVSEKNINNNVEDSKTNISTSEKVETGHVHDYSSATCTKPKTCKICGKIEGSAKGHNFVNGVCSRCGVSLNDTEGPKITILSINPNPVKLGKKVTIRAKITDDSGVKSADVQLCNSVGNVAGGVLNLVEGNTKDGIYEGTFTLPSVTPTGEWKANIYTNDIYGNTGLSWGDAKEKFTVVGDINDTKGPKITILSINPNPVKLGKKVTIRAKITDDSGVKSADVQLCNSVGNVAGGVLNLVEGNTKDGIYEGTFTLPSVTPTGEWKANIYTNDIYGNTGLSWGDVKEKFTVIAP